MGIGTLRRYHPHKDRANAVTHEDATPTQEELIAKLAETDATFKAEMDKVKAEAEKAAKPAAEEKNQKAVNTPDKKG